MGGCSCEDDYEFITPQTVVLVGKTGNGKSATGNSTLGKKVLLSKRSSSGVTLSSVLQATALDCGQMLNVIDTPGLFDSSLGFEFIGKEIVKCINMAQDGVDAFLVVVSTLSRFSEEEQAAISSLRTLFGEKVYDYMIVVFTGGDQLEEDEQTLEDFLCDSSKALKETLSLCGNRCVLFDNKTKDETKRSNQLNELLSLINTVSTMNGGKPYTDEIFIEMKNQMKDLKEQEISVDDERFKHIYEMTPVDKGIGHLAAGKPAADRPPRTRLAAPNLGKPGPIPARRHDGIESIESKFKETTLKLEQQLAEERAACVKAKMKADAAKKKSGEDQHKLKQKLEKGDKALQQNMKELQMKEENAASAKAEKKAKATSKIPAEVKELLRKDDAEKKPKAAKKNPDEEIRMLKEKLQKAEKNNKELRKQKDEELRRKEAHWRQREEDLRIGCYIM